MAVVTDPMQEQSTAPPHSVLVPFDGTLYWVGGSSLGGYSVFKQQLPSGARSVVVPAATNSVALDDTYLYAAVGTGINRYAR